MSVCGLLPKSVVKFRSPVLIAITKWGLPCGIAAALSRLVLRRCCPPPLRCARSRRPKPRVKVRYNEVVRSILYAPAYVAIAKGYFEEAGLDVTMATAQGGDKSVAVTAVQSAPTSR